MKKTLLFSLCALFLTACPGDHNPPTNTDAQVADVAPEVKVSEVVTGDTWEVTLPIAWKQQAQVGKGIVLIAEHESVEAMVLLKKEPYSGSFDEFAIETIRGFRGQGVSVDNTTSTMIEGTPFVFVETSSSDIKNSSWLTVKDGFGYSMDCGGVKTSAAQFDDDCAKISQSLKVK